MKLFERSKIGSVELKNRYVMAPMGTWYGANYILDDRSIAYYEERAKGGFGLIITGGFFNTRIEKFEGIGGAVMDGMESTIPIGMLADKVHNAGSKLCIQLCSGTGRNTWWLKDGMARSASAVDWFWDPSVKCTPYTKEEIKELVLGMQEAAYHSKMCGADMVMIHAYGGYLMDQFMSALWNKRTDEYGGSLENRMRLLKETYDAVRMVVGKDYPIIVKYTPDQCMEGGRTLENEGIEMALMMQDWGVDALVTDLGCYDVWYNCIDTVYSPEGYHTFMAEELKKNGVTIPILVSGNLRNPELAKETVEKGLVDFVMLGHESRTDPYYPTKLKHGQEDDIRPCIGCNECLNAGMKGIIRGCALNPMTYHEYDYKITPAEKPKNILVIGAGPGGISAALTAQSRGHHVTIWEKTDHIGGNLKAAGAPSFKKPIREYIAYLERQLTKHGIPVFYNKEATLEDVKAGQFDHIICAVGSRPVMPKIPGIEGEHVLSSIDAMLGKPLHGNVVVIGGGLVGCEAAGQFAETADSVVLIEMMDGILLTAEHQKNNDQELRKVLAERKINIQCSTTVKAIEKDKVVCEQNGERVEFPCDTVVVAIGQKPSESIIEELKEEYDYEMLDVIGDANKAGRVYEAVHEGFHVALRL